MILSRNYKDINTVYDFYEGIISDITWDASLTDFIITVYYFWDEPRGLKNKDVMIRFKKTSGLNYSCAGMLESMKKHNIDSPHPEIDRITINKDESGIRVEISSNYDFPMISLLCEEIWIESADETA